VNFPLAIPDVEYVCVVPVVHPTRLSFGREADQVEPGRQVMTEVGPRSATIAMPGAVKAPRVGPTAAYVLLDHLRTLTKVADRPNSIVLADRLGPVSGSARAGSPFAAPDPCVVHRR
jgi:hypothetical protein